MQNKPQLHVPSRSSMVWIMCKPHSLWFHLASKARCRRSSSNNLSELPSLSTSLPNSKRNAGPRVPARSPVGKGSKLTKLPCRNPVRNLSAKASAKHCQSEAHTQPVLPVVQKTTQTRNRTKILVQTCQTKSPSQSCQSKWTSQSFNPRLSLTVKPWSWAEGFDLAKPYSKIRRGTNLRMR